MRIGDVNSQALQAIGTAQQVTANNIANVNTEEFQASRTTFETGPEGEGVRVQDIQPISTPGPIVVDSASLNAQETTAPAPLPEGSNTDVPREMTNMMINETAYSANAIAITTRDEMQGTVIDMMA